MTSKLVKSVIAPLVVAMGVGLSSGCNKVFGDYGIYKGIHGMVEKELSNQIGREVRFKNYDESMAFVNKYCPNEAWLDNCAEKIGDMRIEEIKQMDYIYVNEYSIPYESHTEAYESISSKDIETDRQLTIPELMARYGRPVEFYRYHPNYKKFVGGQNRKENGFPIDGDDIKHDTTTGKGRNIQNLKEYIDEEKIDNKELSVYSNKFMDNHPRYNRTINEENADEFLEYIKTQKSAKVSNVKALENYIQSNNISEKAFRIYFAEFMDLNPQYDGYLSEDNADEFLNYMKSRRKTFNSQTGLSQQ